jgi:hypothetical protein
MFSDDGCQIDIKATMDDTLPAALLFGKPATRLPLAATGGTNSQSALAATQRVAG